MDRESLTLKNFTDDVILMHSIANKLKKLIKPLFHTTNMFFIETEGTLRAQVRFALGWFYFLRLRNGSMSISRSQGR